MILAELRDYIRQHRQVTLADLIIRFDIDEAALRPMLDVWIRKGRIHRKMTSASCGSRCNQCSQGTSEYFCWGESEADNPYLPEQGCSVYRS